MTGNAASDCFKEPVFGGAPCDRPKLATGPVAQRHQGLGQRTVQQGAETDSRRRALPQFHPRTDAPTTRLQRVFRTLVSLTHRNMQVCGRRRDNRATPTP